MTKTPQKFTLQIKDSDRGLSFIKSFSNNTAQLTHKIKDSIDFDSIEEASNFFKTTDIKHAQIVGKVANYHYGVQTGVSVWNDTFKLTEAEYNSLLAESISKKDYDELLKKVDNRFYYIIYTIGETFGAKVDWFDYQIFNGSFDSKNHKKTISYFGKFEFKKDSKINEQTLYLLPFSEELPTSWLKDNFEQELASEFKKILKKEHDKVLSEKKEKELFAQKVEDMKQIIFSKLNEEEQQFIGMLEPSKIAANLKKLEAQKNKQKHMKKR